jgi:hypothetical protein
MSNFMLDDKHSMDKLNPFVVHDFSLPGGIRQTDRTEVGEYFNKDATIKKQPSGKNLCEKQKVQTLMNAVIHPKLNIDYGVSCKKQPVFPSVSVGVSELKKGPVWVYLAPLVILTLIVAVRR